METNVYKYAGLNENFNKLSDKTIQPKGKHYPCWLVKFRKYKHRRNKWITSGTIKLIKYRYRPYKGRNTLDQLSPNYNIAKQNLTGYPTILNTLRPRQDGRHFPDDIFKCIFLNENVRISIDISLKFVSKGLINNIPALIQIMAWRRPGDKPLSEAMMESLLTHMCVTRPQWIKRLYGKPK